MAGSITKQFDFIINSATPAVSKKCDLKLPRSTSFNYFVAESIMARRKPNIQARTIVERQHSVCSIPHVTTVFFCGIRQRIGSVTLSIGAALLHRQNRVCAAKLQELIQNFNKKLVCYWEKSLEIGCEYFAPTQILPVNNSTTKMTRTKPRTPLGP